MQTKVFGILLAVSLAVACGGSGDEYQLIVGVRAGLEASEDYGVQSGEPIPGVELEVLGPGENDPPLNAVTDEDGEATLDLPGPGAYTIFAVGKTTDPLCVWLGSGQVTVEREATALSLDDLAVACE